MSDDIALSDRIKSDRIKAEGLTRFAESEEMENAKQDDHENDAQHKTVPEKAARK